MNKCFVPIQQIQEYLGKELTGFQVIVISKSPHPHARTDIPGSIYMYVAITMPFPNY